MKLLNAILISALAFTAVFSAVAQNEAGKSSAEETAKADFVNKAYDLLFWRQNPDGTKSLVYNWNKPAVVYAVSVEKGKTYTPGRKVMTLDIPGRSKAHVEFTESCSIVNIPDSTVPAGSIKPGTVLLTVAPSSLECDSVSDSAAGKDQRLPSVSAMLRGLWESTGIYDICRQSFANFETTWILGIGRVVMLLVGILLLYLAIFKEFEPLLLLPIGFGAVLSNIPLAGISGPDGLLGMVYYAGIETGVFPLLIFMGVGAMTDFGPLIANPKTALLGAAAQLGIFMALIGALALTACGIGIDFSLKDAASIGIIGGADGPTSIYLTSKLAPQLLGAIAVAAYSYMALVPIIQPPIMRLLTTKKERMIKMTQLRHVSKMEKICFPIIITLLCALLLPDAAPLVGMLMFGNLMRESGVVERLSSTAQNALINIVTIFLGLAVGSKLSADQFLNMKTLGILVLGIIAFSFGTAGGVLFGKVMCYVSGGKINPLIGAAGVSAVPMAARVVNKVGMEDDPHNMLLMHAMGPNVAGVIGSAVVAGILLKALT